MMPSDDLVAKVAHLLWCMNEGYLLAEDREILTGPTIFERPDNELHPDDLEEKPGWLSMARDLIDTVRTPILSDCVTQIEALPQHQQSRPHAIDCPGRPGWRGICTCDDRTPVAWIALPDVLAILQGEKS